MKKLISSLLLAVSAALFSASALAGNVAEVLNAFGSSVGTYDNVNAAFGAIATGSDGSTLRLLADCTVTGCGDFEKSFTIDLNGFTLTADYSSKGSDNYFVSPGKDAKGKTLTIKNGNFVCGSRCKGIVNLIDGTLSMEGVTITSSGASPDILQEGGTATIKNCTFGGDSRSGSAVYAEGGIGTVESCTVTVQKGSSPESAVLRVNGNASLTVKGGTYTGSVSGSAYSLAIGSAGGTIMVSDGTFRGGFYKANGTIELSGGTYYTDPSDYVAAGYEVVMGDFNWTIQKKAQVDYVAQDDAGNSYPSLAEAFSGTAANGTITLLKDCTVSSKISHSKNVSLDMDGHQIDINSSSDMLFEVTGGNFTLYGGGKIVAKRGVFEWSSLGTLSVQGVTMETGDSSVDYPGNFFKAGTVNITDTTITSAKFTGICASGTCTVNLGSGNAVTVQGGTSSASAAIYLQSKDATVNVTGGYYKSASYGVYITTSGGKFTMSGGTLEAGTAVLYNDGWYQYALTGSMTITGGQFKLTDKTKYLAVAGHNGAEKDNTSITGGEFNVTTASRKIQRVAHSPRQPPLSPRAMVRRR